MTVQEANDTRKGLTGKTAYITWRRYMDDQADLDLSVDKLRAWDEKHNYKALRASFGDNDYLIELGIKQKYNSFINQYSVLNLKPGNTKSPTKFNIIRTDENRNRVSLADADESQKQYFVDRIKYEVQASTRRLRAFQYNWNEIHGLVSGWLFEMEEE